MLGSVTADDDDRDAVLDFVLRYFPAQFDFITTQLDAFRDTALTFGVAGTIGADLGRARRLRRDQHRGQLRLGRREDSAASGSTSCSRS